MTVKTYNNEVELTFDNGIESGYINFETDSIDDEKVNVDFSEHIGEHYSTAVDKQNLITFLEKSLEMLKGEV